MYNRIMEFLNINGILHEMQYGFRQGRSFEHALQNRYYLTHLADDRYHYCCSSTSAKRSVW